MSNDMHILTHRLLCNILYLYLCIWMPLLSELKTMNQTFLFSIQQSYFLHPRAQGRTLCTSNTTKQRQSGLSGEGKKMQPTNSPACKMEHVGRGRRHQETPVVPDVWIVISRRFLPTVGVPPSAARQSPAWSENRKRACQEKQNRKCANVKPESTVREYISGSLPSNKKNSGL